MDHYRQTTRHGFEGGDENRMNLIIAAATEFVDDILDRVHMILEPSDHSTRRIVDDNNSLVERDRSLITDESLEISPRGLSDGLFDEIAVYSTVERMFLSESVISDDDDAEGILLHLSVSAAAAAQFDSAKELVAVSTRYFRGDRPSLQQDTGVLSIAVVDQVNEAGVDKRPNPIEPTPMTSPRIGFQIPEEFPTSSADNDEKTWVPDRKQTCRPLESHPNHTSADERRSWSSADEEETMVVLQAGTDVAAASDIEEDDRFLYIANWADAKKA